MTTPSDAAMRAANKILDQWETRRPPSSDAIRDIIDAEFAPLVKALRKAREEIASEPEINSVGYERAMNVLSEIDAVLAEPDGGE